MNVLIRYFVFSYIFGAFYMYRIGGNFTIRLNTFFKSFFMVGIDQIFNKFFFKNSVKQERYNILAVILQMFSIIYFLLIPITIHYLKLLTSISLGDVYIQSFIIFNQYGWVICIVLILDIVIEELRKKRIWNGNTATQGDGPLVFYDYTTNALKAGPEPDLYLKNYTWQHTWYKYVKKRCFFATTTWAYWGKEA